MNKINYFLVGVGKVIWNDLKSLYDMMAKPKEIIKILLYIFIVELFQNKIFFAKITLGLMVGVYFWGVIKDGYWKHLMRERYIKKSP